MCGRYFTYVMQEGMSGGSGKRDVYPSEWAVILCRRQAGDFRGPSDDLVRTTAVWGFPAPEGRQLIINARAETALERKMFCDRIRRDRCAIPAGGFYEWNRNKEKNEFYREDGKTLYMAGVCGEFAGERRFVILTTEANPSVSPIHDRMPLILEESEVREWIMEDGPIEYYLAKKPGALRREQEYEQLSLFKGC